MVLPKLKWYAMMKERFPPQLELISDFEVNATIRELSEGILKYEGTNTWIYHQSTFVNNNIMLWRNRPIDEATVNGIAQPANWVMG